MEGTRMRGGQSTTMLDWMKNYDEEYEHIKNNRARNGEEWRHWRPGPAFKQAEYLRKKERERYTQRDCKYYILVFYRVAIRSIWMCVNDKAEGK